MFDNAMARVPGVWLDAVARQLARRATQLAEPKRSNLLRAARSVEAVAAALNAGDADTLRELDAAASGSLKRLQRRGERVAWATQSAADRDAELVAFCETQLGWLRQGLTVEDFVEGATTWLRGHGYAPVDERVGVRAALTSAFAGGVDDTQSASTVARRMLRALGAKPAELKNFGAGAKQRERRKSPNRSR